MIGRSFFAHVDFTLVNMFHCRQLDDSDRASVFLRDQEGRTGLHYAALMGGWSQLIVLSLTL